MNSPINSKALFLGSFSSPLGGLLIVFDSKQRVRCVDFADYEARMERLLRIHYGEINKGYTLTNKKLPGALVASLADYFSGRLTALDMIPVATAGTEFQKIVWDALRKIKPGSTISYAELAKTIGRPNAMRAVGLANGANPIGIIVPCHRVIGSDGSLTGYAGGIERKQWLLNHEQIGVR